jgi:hypothetical protein
MADQTATATALPSVIRPEQSPPHRRRGLGSDVVAEDRISVLPDAILQNIVSRLPIKEAVRTGALGRRWRVLFSRNGARELAAERRTSPGGRGGGFQTAAEDPIRALPDVRVPIGVGPAPLGQKLTAERATSPGGGGGAFQTAAEDPPISALPDGRAPIGVGTTPVRHDLARRASSSGGGVESETDHSLADLPDPPVRVHDSATCVLWLDVKDRLSRLSDRALRLVLSHLPGDEAVRTCILSRRWSILAPAPAREDRLSALHVDLACSILALVPLVGAVRTTVLSQNWRDVWIYLPVVRFDDDAAAAAGVSNFCDFVDGVLNGLSPEIHLQTFEVRICLSKSVNGPRLTSWAAQAAERVPGDIAFDISLHTEYSGQPVTIYLPCSGEEKTLTWTISDPEDIRISFLSSTERSFTRLEKMVLQGLRISEDSESMSFIVTSCCPKLTELELSDIRGVCDLYFKNNSLRSVKIRFAVNLRSLIIVASYLSQLEVTYSFWGHKSKFSVFILETPNIKILDWEDTWPNTLQVSASWLQSMMSNLSQVQVAIVAHRFKIADDVAAEMIPLQS